MKKIDNSLTVINCMSRISTGDPRYVTPHGIVSVMAQDSDTIYSEWQYP